MRIGILGAGMIGGTLGRLWRKAGHDVRFGTRHPEEIEALTQELKAAAGSPEEAVAFGEVILLAVPLGAVPTLGPKVAASLRGKVVLDAANAYPSRDGEYARAASAHPDGSSAWVAMHVPGARLVKAFNTVYFKTLQERAHVGNLGIPLASDDPEALRLTQTLVKDAGFTPVVVGGLANGKRFEPGTAVYNTGLDGVAVAKALGVAAP